MFDGLNNNRAHWNELAEVYNAKMKAIEDEKKKLEEEEAKKGIKVKQGLHRSNLRPRSTTFLIFLFFGCFFFLLAGGGEVGKSKTCTIC